MAVFDHFCPKYTTKPPDILDLARKIILYNGNFIFWIFKMLGWPNFGQNFEIFGLKSLKMAVLTLFCPNDTTRPPDILDLVIK